MASCRLYIENITKDEDKQNQLTQYHNQIFKRLIDSKLFNKWNDFYFLPSIQSGNYSKAKALISQINQQWGTPVAGTAFTKTNAKEYVFVNVKNLVDYSPQQVLFQTEEITSSVASSETVTKVKKLLNKWGVKEQSLLEYAERNGVEINGVNGLADLVQGIVAVAENREAQTLPEEAIHIATAILEQTNPSLYTQLLSKVDRFQMYQTVFDEYKERYTTKDGKPDIRRIKKEALDKLIVEVVINKEEGSTEYPDLLKEENISTIEKWWNSILDFIRGIYRSSNISIFEEAADIILNHNIGNVADIQAEGIQFQVSPKQQIIADKLLETSKILNKVYKEEEADDILKTEEEANNWYEKQIDGEWRRIEHRVTDKVKGYYRKIKSFRDKVFTTEEKATNSAKARLGIKNHAAMDNIFNRYIDQDTNLPRTIILDRPDKSPVPGDNKFEAYNMLEKYASDLIKQYPGSQFFTEKMIFNPDLKVSKEGKKDGYKDQNGDKKEFVDGEAGTFDLLIVEPSGRGNIYDWKFMGNQKDDIATYKQGGYNVQLETYKQILKKYYGVESFGQVRAIPIMMDIQKAPSGNFILKGIAVGTVDTSQITEIKLLPVPSESERTGNKALDVILDRLQNVYNKLSKEKAQEDQKKTKRERLNILRKALRIIQTTQSLFPLQEAMEVYNSQLEAFLGEYEAQKENIKNLSEKDKDKLAENFLDLSELIGYYSNVTTELGDFLKSEDEETKKIAEDIAKEQVKILRNEYALKEAKEEFVNSIGEANEVFGILKPEKVIKGLYKLFKSFDEYSNKAARLIVTLYNKAEADAIENSTTFNKEVSSLVSEINKAKLSFSKLKKEKKNELINELSKELFDTFSETQDKAEFIKENITDLEAYTKEVEAIKKEKIEKIQNRAPLFTGEYEEQNKQEAIDDIERAYNPLNPGSMNQTVLKYLNRDKWYTSEFRELLQPQNKPLLDLYRKIQELNEIAYESGYIDYKQKRSFLPFMEKSLMDKMLTNGWNVFNVPGNIIKSLNAYDKSSIGYSEITGQRVSELPKPFTTPVEDTSEELGQALILYSQAMFKYQAVSSIDEQIELILQIEKLKDHIATNRFGDAIIEDKNGIKEAKTVTGNEENAETLYNFVQYLVYNNRYPLSQDVKLGTNQVINKTKELINKTFGTKLEPSDTPTSMIKMVDAINRAFQLKTLGGNPISGAVNWFGANIQALAQRNNYFTLKEFTSSQTKLQRMMEMSEKDGTTFSALVDKFNPFTDNENYELFKKASSKAAGRFNLGDVFMIFMRKPELLIQASVFEATLKNMMTQDGKIVNITDYVKSKYTDRYTKGSEYLKETNTKIQEEVSKLKVEKSIYNTAEIKEDQLLIDGQPFDNKEEIRKLSILSKTLYRRITGNVSSTSVNQAKLDIFTSSMMVFKNWIPKLWYTRFGKLEQKNDPFNKDAFDVGRIRVMMSIPGFIIDKAKNISAITKGTEHGLNLLDDLYQKYSEDYKLNTGEDFTMDRAAFNDMIIQNLQNQTRELAILCSLLATGIALGFIEPPEDKRAKAALNITKKIFDQFAQELSFFYNPLQFQEMLSGGTFPSLGLVNDIEKFTSNFLKETTGTNIFKPLLTPEEVREQTPFIKSTLRLFPVASSWLKFTTLFSPDLAEELDIALPQAESKR